MNKSAENNNKTSSFIGSLGSVPGVVNLLEDMFGVPKEPRKRQEYYEGFSTVAVPVLVVVGTMAVIGNLSKS